MTPYKRALRIVLDNARENVIALREAYAHCEEEPKCVQQVLDAITLVEKRSGLVGRSTTEQTIADTTDWREATFSEIKSMTERGELNVKRDDDHGE